MKMLLHLMESPVTSVMIAALKSLSRILISEYMKQSWSNFRELILLKIIDCYKASKEVCLINVYYTFVHELIIMIFFNLFV